MKLDIMTLMAASANVSQGTATTPQAGDALTAGDAGQPPEGGSFLSLLQTLTAEVDAGQASDAALPTLADAAAAGRGAGLTPEPVAAQLANSDADAALAAADADLWLTGQSLPADGKSLPPHSESLADQGALEGEGARAESPLLATLLPTANPQAGDARLEPQAASTNGANAGWYSNAARQAGALPDPGAASAQQQNPRVTPTASDAAATAVAASADGSREPLQNLPLDTPLARAGEGSAAAAQPVRPDALIQALRGSDVAPDTARSPAIESPTASPLTQSATPTERAERALPMLSLQRPGWDRALGEQITVMAGRGIETAELKLDPPSLGTVHVKLMLQGDQAQLLVQSANGAVRDLMESALPRLRDMLSSEGVTVDSAQVTDREQTQRESREQREQVHEDRAQDDGAAGSETAREGHDAIAQTDAELTPERSRLHIRV